MGLASESRRWDKARGVLSALSLDFQACGVAVFKVGWSDTVGYTYLHRPIHVFFLPNVAVTQSTNRRTIELLHRN